MEYGRQILSMKDGSPKELTQKLVFTPTQAAGDPGQSIMDQLKKADTKQAEEARPEEATSDEAVVE